VTESNFIFRLGCQEHAPGLTHNVKRLPTTLPVLSLWLLRTTSTRARATRTLLVGFTFIYYNLKVDKFLLEWVPPLASYVCTYVRAWVRTKRVIVAALSTLTLSPGSGQVLLQTYRRFCGEKFVDSHVFTEQPEYLSFISRAHIVSCQLLNVSVFCIITPGKLHEKLINHLYKLLNYLICCNFICMWCIYVVFAILAGSHPSASVCD
jgi:hypothetical protein